MEAPSDMRTSALRVAKKIFLTGASTFGAYSAFKNSNWRKQRLLILGYHGLSLQDEHVWRPGLFMTPEQFAGRLEIMSKVGCAVLPLGEAIDRLGAGTLPPMSVAITFDDGFYNFFAAAHPILKRFDFPSTVYQTTYYVGWNKPIFHLLCHYLFWKATGKNRDAQPIVGRAGHFDLRTVEGLNSAGLEVWNFARANGLSPAERQQLAKRLAESVGVDYQEIAEKRLFNLMNGDELSGMVKSGVDVQLHTHRHRVPVNKDLFLKNWPTTRSS